jgi:hypothetical protein
LDTMWRNWPREREREKHGRVKERAGRPQTFTPTERSGARRLAAFFGPRFDHFPAATGARSKSQSPNWSNNGSSNGSGGGPAPGPCGPRSGPAAPPAPAGPGRAGPASGRWVLVSTPRVVQQRPTSGRTAVKSVGQTMVKQRSHTGQTRTHSGHTAVQSFGQTAVKQRPNGGRTGARGTRDGGRGRHEPVTCRTDSESAQKSRGGQAEARTTSTVNKNSLNSLKCSRNNQIYFLFYIHGSHCTCTANSLNSLH